jgi:hypothetical protein
MSNPLKNISTANGWSDLTYAMIDAEYFVSCFFFVVCIILLNFWLMNIFVAVIINTFGTIREETKHSAFAGRLWVSAAKYAARRYSHRTHIREADPLLEEPAARGKSKSRTHSATWRRVFRWTNWAWIAAIVADVGVQASKTAKDSQERKELLSESGTNIPAKVKMLSMQIQIPPNSTLHALSSLKLWSASWPTSRTTVASRREQATLSMQR